MSYVEIAPTLHLETAPSPADIEVVPGVTSFVAKLGLRSELGFETAAQYNLALLYSTARDILDSTQGQGDSVVTGTADEPCKYRFSIEPDSDGKTSTVPYVEVRVEEFATRKKVAYYLLGDSIRIQSQGLDSEVLPHESIAPINYVYPGEAVLDGLDLSIASAFMKTPLKYLQELYPKIDKDPKPQSKSYNWQRFRRMTAVVTAVAAVTAPLVAREYDKYERQSITPTAFGLPAGTKVALDRSVKPQPVNVSPDRYQDLFSLSDVTYVDGPLMGRLLKPREDTALTAADGLRTITLDIGGECRSTPLPGFSNEQDKLMGWTSYRRLGGATLSQLVSLKIVGSQISGYSLETCVDALPGLFDQIEHSTNWYPDSDTATIFVHIDRST